MNLLSQGIVNADCDVSHKSRDNPSGCLGDLFAWVETSIGAGSNGKAPATPFTDQTTKEGSNALGFYNVNNGARIAICIAGLTLRNTAARYRAIARQVCLAVPAQ